MEKERDTVKLERDKAKESEESVRKEKEECAVQAAQALGQIESLKQQNSELLSKLTANSGNSRKLILHVKSKNPMTAKLNESRAASESIEKNILVKAGLSRIHSQETAYENTLVFEVQGSEENVKQLLTALVEKCTQEAEKFKCSAELEFK
jgi:hypothetical protein